MSDIHHLTDKEKEIAQLLQTVIDPEVAINIVDLGLVYEINFDLLIGFSVFSNISSSWS